MEQNVRKMTLSQIRDLLQTIHETCRRFQLISLRRQLNAAESLLSQNPLAEKSS